MAQVRTETVAAPPPDGQFTRRRGGVSALYEGAIRAFCSACAAVSVITTFGILFVLIKESLVFFREVPILEFFTGRAGQLLSRNDASHGHTPLSNSRSRS